MQRFEDYPRVLNRPAPRTPATSRGGPVSTRRLTLDEAIAIAGVASAPRTRRGRRSRADDQPGTLTEAQYRNWQAGTHTLSPGSYAIRDARGRTQGRIDIGEQACRRSLMHAMTRGTQTPVDVPENRPRTGKWPTC
jgi:hypothetical protein